MKTLNKNQSAQIKVLVKSLISQKDETKKDLLQKEIIAKFGLDNFENAFKALDKKSDLIIIPKADQLLLNASNTIDIPSNEADQQNNNSDVQITNDLLSALNAIGITDKLKAKSGKSIFKSEFNNKSDRTKCRNAFQNSISLYLLHLAKDKKDLAQAEFVKIKSIADKYYIAESSFKNKADYCTDNMEDNKKELIALFISNVPIEIVVE